MLKLLKYLSLKDRLYALFCLILVAGQVWFDLTMPDFMSDITKLIVTPGSPAAEIWIAGIKMLSCAIASAALSVKLAEALRDSADNGSVLCAYEG